MSKAQDYARAQHEQTKADFLDLLRIPSISTDMAYKADVRRAAEWIAAKMRAIGLTAELIEMDEGNHPVVLGTWDGAGASARTVLIYCHYDVQPAVVADGWDSEPFEPVEKDGQIFARGATDSKVHVIAQMAAVEALIASGECQVNIKLVFEGEEESGGRTINAIVAQHIDKLQADVAVISDGVIRGPKQPALIYGLRGIITMELHVYGPQTDLHSGHWGGTVHNPAQALAEIIAQLHDANGTVTVPHFYDDVATITDEEHAVLAESEPSINEEWDEVANAAQRWGEADYNLHERIGARPTLEINGIAGGYYGDGFKTVLPAHAMAKISCRLVPDQDPRQIIQHVKDHIQALAPPSVGIEFRNEDAYAPAAVLDRKRITMQAAYRAYEQGWGVKPVWERAGGSVPITYEMLKITPEVVLMGFSYKGGRAHGPNENIYLDMLYNGVNTMIHFLREMGETQA